MYLISRAFNVVCKKGAEHANHVSKQIFEHNIEKHVTNYSFKRHCSIGAEHEEINYNDITNGDKALEHKLKVLMLEADVMRQDGKNVPDHSFLEVSHWKEILNLPSRSARGKYLDYLFKLSKKKENEQVKKEARRLAYAEYQAKKEPKKEETLEEFAFKYDLQHNNLFLRIYETTINQMYNNRLIQAIQFGQKLVIDCGYDINMTKRENFNCAKQIMLLFADNRMHDDPFDVHLCNVNKESDLIKQLYKYIPTIEEPWFPLNVHESSYLDLYPKQQLVYLTPHCREEIHEYDHDAIYIVGAIVDKINQEPLSLAKAKREGLKMAKLPLDKYLQWGSGSGKSLTINQMISILLDQKATENWEHSFRHIPRRKLMEDTTTIIPNKTYNRRKQNSIKTNWKPSYNNINFDNLSYNKNSGNDKVKSKINVRSLWDE